MKLVLKIVAVALLIALILCLGSQGSGQQTTITYTYDKLNRLTGVIYSGGASIIYTYDAAGNRTAVQVTGGNSNPAIARLNPPSATAGTPGIVLTVSGGNFLNNSIVQWNGANRSTTFVSNTQLNASITGTDLSVPGSANITVLNPGNQTSNAVAFTITIATSSPSPTPSPTPSPAAAADLSLTTTVSHDVIIIDNNVSYTSMVRNNGPATASNTTFVSTFPIGLNVVSVTPSQGLCSVNSNPDFQFMKLDLPFARIPDRLPSDIPLEEPGNAVTQNYIGSTNRGQYQATREFVTTRTLDAAIAIYHTYLNSHGWSTNAVASFENLRVVSAQKDGIFIQVSSGENTVSHIRTIDINVSSGGFVCSLGDVPVNSTATVSATVKPSTPGALINQSNVFSDVIDPNLLNNSTTSQTAVLPSAAPLLFTEENTTRGIALDSVTLLRDPMPMTALNNLSSDHRTRVTFFAANVNLLPGESLSVLTAQAEDSQQRVFPLTVEYAGKVPGLNWLTEIVVRLPDGLPTGSDVQVRISFRGVLSNQVLLGIKP